MIIYSFGFKFSTPPKGSRVIDMRACSNPHNNHALRDLNGTDMAVQQYMMEDPKFISIVDAVVAEHGTQDIAFGCHGGRHRSVAAAEIVASRLSADVRHMEKSRWR